MSVKYVQKKFIPNKNGFQFSVEKIHAVLERTRSALLKKQLKRFSLLLSFTVSSLETVIGLYGETLEIPCNNGAINAKEIMMTKWKYVSHKEGQWIQNGGLRLTPSYHVWTTPSLSAYVH